MSKSFISTYTYDTELTFNPSSGESMDILPECVKYILIDHDFSNKIMPVIYMKIALTPSIYNAMVPDQGKGKLYFNLKRKRKKGSTSSAYKKVIYDEFDYFMTDDPNSYKKLDTYGESTGSAYKICYIGLIKIALQTSNQKSFGGVYKNTNMMSLVQSATTDMSIVIQPFSNNTNIESFTCPAISTIGQFLSYMNNQYNFYNGPYTYYLDFDKVYLRSNDGSYIDAKDGDLKYIAFDIRDLDAKYNSLSTGIVEDDDQDAYIIYVPASDAQIVIDRVNSDLNGTVTAVNSKEGTIIDTSVVDTSAVTNISTNIEASTLITSTDPNAATYVTTSISASSDTLVITKADMDSRIFTLNKQYMLSYYQDNSKYCGVYYMTRKQEIYLRVGTAMNCQMTISMKKCAEFSNSTTKSTSNKSSSTTDNDMPTNV